VIERQIPFAPGYLVTSEGQVISLRRGVRRVLRPRPNSDGYSRAALFIDGERIDLKVHRLVALVFIGSPPDDATEVRHADGNRTNNSAENLSWGTHAENMADMAQHYASGIKVRKNDNYPRGDANPSRRMPERMARGERVSSAKLNEKLVREILTRISRGESDLSVARAYGVNDSSIYAIRKNKNWKHIERPQK